VNVENDYFDFWIKPQERPDQDYTQGARLTGDFARVPSTVRRHFCKEAACSSTLEFGQEIYTPPIDATLPVPGQRPYAGWLYTRAGSTAANVKSRRTIDAIAGVTGTPSLGEWTQTKFHSTFGFRPPLGWGNQLPTEVAFALQMGESWYLHALESPAKWIDFVPETHATVGTLRTALGAGGRVRAGMGLTHPWMAGATPTQLEGYLFAGGQAEAVGRDLFLDGSTFESSIHVDREPLTANWERGFGLRFRRIGLEYGVVSQSREYRTGSSSHTYAGITVTWWTVR